MLRIFGRSRGNDQPDPPRKPTWAPFWLSRFKRKKIELICNSAATIAMAKRIPDNPTQEDVLERFAGERILRATKYKEFRKLEKYDQHVNFMFVVACKYDDEKLRDMNLDSYFKGRHGEYLNWLRADLRKLVETYPNAEEKKQLRKTELSAELQRLQGLADVV